MGVCLGVWSEVGQAGHFLPPASILLHYPQGPAGQAGDSVATQGVGVGAAQAPAPLPSDRNQGSLESGPHFPPVEQGDFWAASHSGSVGGDGCEARWGVDGCCGSDRLQGSPGDFLEWWGQAGQMEGPGAAVTANELPTIPAHSAFILVLLTQKETTCSWGWEWLPASQRAPRTAPLQVPHGRPGPPVCSAAG